jgi:hypothetical protein
LERKILAGFRIKEAVGRGFHKGINIPPPKFAARRIEGLTGAASCMKLMPKQNLHPVMATTNHFQYIVRQTEYEGTQKGLHHDQSFLEGLGGDGWDLATVIPIVEGGKTVRLVYYLKKQSTGSLI